MQKLIALIHDLKNLNTVKKEYYEKGYAKAQTYFLKKMYTMNKTYNRKLSEIKKFYKETLVYRVAEKDKEIKKLKKEIEIQRKNVSKAYELFESSIKRNDEVCRQLNNQIEEQLNIAAEQQVRVNNITREMENLKRSNNRNKETIKKLLSLPENVRVEEYFETGITLSREMA